MIKTSKKFAQELRTRDDEMIELKRRIEDSRGVIEGMKAHIGDLSTQVTKY